MKHYRLSFHIILLLLFIKRLSLPFSNRADRSLFSQPGGLLLLLLLSRLFRLSRLSRFVFVGRLARLIAALRLSGIPVAVGRFFSLSGSLAFSLFARLLFLFPLPLRFFLTERLVFRHELHTFVLHVHLQGGIKFPVVVQFDFLFQWKPCGKQILFSFGKLRLSDFLRDFDFAHPDIRQFVRLSVDTDVRRNDFARFLVHDFHRPPQITVLLQALTVCIRKFDVFVRHIQFRFFLDKMRFKILAAVRHRPHFQSRLYLIALPCDFRVDSDKVRQSGFIQVFQFSAVR